MTAATDSATPASPSAVPIEPTNYRLVLRVLTAAAFVVILNETIMLTAIPRLMSSLDITARAAQWLSTGFMLTMAIVIPTTGWFLQRVSRRAAFTTAMGTFLAGTMIAGIAPGFALLLLGRIVQAVGTAIMMPLLMTTLMSLVPAHERGRVMGNVTLAISVAPALGPTVSGFILQLGSWRLLFFLVLPIALVISVVGLRLLPQREATAPTRLDLLSVPLTALGVGGLIYALSEFGEGAEAGAAPVVSPWLALVVGVLGVASMVWRQVSLQRAGRAPLLNLRVLRYRGFTLAVALMSVSFMAMMGAMILLQMYLQDGAGRSALEAGLVLMPGGLAMGLLGPTVGRLYDRYGARLLVRPGAVLIVVMMALTTWAIGSTPWWFFAVLHPLLSLGLALVFTPVFTSGLGSLPTELYSHGSAFLSTMQQVAAAAGTATAIAVMTLRQGTQEAAGFSESAAITSGVQWGFGVGAAITLLALILAFQVRRPEGDNSATTGPSH